MPRKKKIDKEGLMKHFTAEFIRSGEELLDDHAEDMEAVLEAAETGKLAFGIRGLIDTSESRPKLTTRLTFSEVHTDERVVQLDDPKQGTFSAIVEGAKGGIKKSKKTTVDVEEGND